MWLLVSAYRGLQIWISYFGRWQELAAGYMSGKLLLKLDAISLILVHHTSEQFAFFNEPANARNRTVFYYTLARLLFMEDTPSKFKSFVAPLNQVWQHCTPRCHIARGITRVLCIWFLGMACFQGMSMFCKHIQM